LASNKQTIYNVFTNTLLKNYERWYWQLYFGSKMTIIYRIPIMSYDGIVYHLIIKWWLRSSTLFNINNRAAGKWASMSIVLGVSVLPHSTIFQLNFGTVPIVWYLLFSFYLYRHGNKQRGELNSTCNVFQRHVCTRCRNSYCYALVKGVAIHVRQ